MSGQPSPLGPRLMIVQPEIGHCDTTRFKLASAGPDALPVLAASWESTPSLRAGVAVTFGMMLWYSDSIARPLGHAERVVARRHLLRCAVAEEAWLRTAFVEAAEWTHDPTYLPWVRTMQPSAATLRKLELELVHIDPAELTQALLEQWEAMCAEGWVADDGLRRSALLAFGSARSALAEQDGRTARAVLAALSANLGAARGRGLRLEGYELMRSGLDAVTARF